MASKEATKAARMQVLDYREHDARFGGLGTMSRWRSFRMRSTRLLPDGWPLPRHRLPSAFSLPPCTCGDRRRTEGK